MHDTNNLMYTTMSKCNTQLVCAVLHKSHLPYKPRPQCQCQGLAPCQRLQHQYQHLRLSLSWEGHSLPSQPLQSRAAMMKWLSNGAEGWPCFMMKCWHRLRPHMLARLYACMYKTLRCWCFGMYLCQQFKGQLLVRCDISTDAHAIISSTCTSLFYGS